MSITYGVGMAAKEWFKAGMPSDFAAARERLQRAMKDATDKLDALKHHPDRDRPLGDESKRFFDERD